MPRIILLDESTANRIAAGEVVERPASVVKELMENSFDAGAARINVEIRDGGLTMIKVVDDGCGMDQEDASTAFQRHATSKISSIEDLGEISSLGFRGEALPSIAAVSKTVLITRPPGAVSGTRLEVQGGRIISESPAGCPPGTSITVSDLFYNTPARLKYMKSGPTEAGQISEIVSRLALARPDVAVTLSSEGRTTVRTPGGDSLLDAVAAVYGPDPAREMLPLEASEEGVSVSGLLAPPASGRSSKRHITVIINGRYVRNHLIVAAVIEGYGTLIPRGRFPLAVITMTMDPGVLDVNVHPSKMVVRVTGENRIFNLVRRSVTATLRTDRVIPAFRPPGGGEEHAGGESPGPAAVPLYRFLPARPSRPVSLFTPSPAAAGESPVREDATPYPAGPPPRAGAMEGGGILDEAYPIGFLPPTYILAAGGGGLLIIDHHAAHERILYERFLALFSRERVDSQILLVPAVIQLSPREYQAAEESLDLLAGLGIAASGFGSGSLAVREIPAGLPDGSAEELIRDLLEYLVEAGSLPEREGLVKKIATSAACRAAIKSGTRSTLDEARAIINDLKRTEVPYTCPHGRPTIISITGQELKARFKRT